MRTRLSLFGLILGMALLSGCSAPQLELTSSPQGTRLFLNGNYAGVDELRLELPYYGSITVDGFPPGREPESQAHGEFRQVLRIEPPANPWLFPLDFFLEIGTWALTTEQPHRAEYAAPELEADLVVGRSPDLTGLRTRGMAARIER